MGEEDGGGEGRRWWWWAAASSIQLGAGIAWYRRGYKGRGSGMPFEAFAIATLFVGGCATTAGAALLSNGIQSVDDMKEAGMNIRRWIMMNAGGAKKSSPE